MLDLHATDAGDTSTTPGARRERGRGLDRLLTFVDAVVAIAITLLVLPLVDLASEFSSDDSVVGLLRDHEAQVGAFLLSFVVIASLWASQHQVMGPVVQEQPLVGRLLLLWTLSIVVLPFPTALVAVSGHQVATKVLYVGTMAASSACLGLIAVVLRRHPEVCDDSVVPDPAPALVTVALFALALLLSLLLPGVGYWPLLVLLASSRVVALWRRVGARRSSVGE